ncbi:DUF3179 domain-containing protein [Halosimplex carlsbadense]|uniref:DUF3179 domain-containing protein n=1 Tax=Halosimplex carlsbadense TaxID=171164 RepID=UPI00067776F0|nr:DUF3179 domain-containing protein [Halosimplex carlsbadense]
MNVRQVIPRDAIPSVDDPAFGAEYPGAADDLVVAVETDDRAKAYPVRYLQFHEVVNDTVDGDPIAVTWCPLCGSAVVYGRRHEGQTLEFGVSGKLADDDLVLYDRETGSEWKQSSGDCIEGDFAGDTLSVQPASVLPWGRFRDAHPDGVVLRRPGGESEAASEGDAPAPIDYDESPYSDYFESDGFGLAAHRGDGSREWDGDDLDPKTVVLGVEVGDKAVGFPLPRVRDADGVVRATVGARDIVVFATPDAGIHGYVDPGYAFVVTEGGVAADGTVWDPATGRAADGRALERLPTCRLFAFAWRDDHGPDAFYRPD